jgi:hypothetical protein
MVNDRVSRILTNCTTEVKKEKSQKSRRGSKLKKKQTLLKPAAQTETS